MKNKSLEQQRREWWQARCDATEARLDRMIREVQAGIDKLYKRVDPEGWRKEFFKKLRL